MVISSLTITNTAANGYAEYPLTTTPGREYIARLNITLGATVQADFGAYDIGGVITSTSTTTSQQVQVRFTARQKVTQLRAVVVDGVGTSITVTALTAIDTATGDEIGVILDNGTTQWSFVNFISGLSVTPRDTFGTAATGAVVYYSGDPIDRPLSIVTARYQDSLTTTEIPTQQWSRTDYFEQPNKSSRGIISQWYYSPQLRLGELYVWQVASRNNNVLRFTYVRPTDVSSTNADQPDFPSEWFLPLAYNLALILAPEYSVPDQRVAQLKMHADEMLENALGFDNEDSYLRIEVE